MSVSGKVIRWSVRLVLLAAAIALALGGPLPNWVGRAVPGLSPLTALASSIAQRRWYLPLVWIAPVAAMLALAVWKGRWFCRWACPLGTLYAIPSRLSIKRRVLKFRISPLLFWIIIGGAIAAVLLLLVPRELPEWVPVPAGLVAWLHDIGKLGGAPLLLVLDPLSTFNRFTPLVTGTWTVASIIAGVIVPVMLILGAIQPMIWCTHLCPLGYGLELARSVRKPGPVATFNQTRRSILAGLVVGIGGAIIARKFLLANPHAKASQKPVLPPGAKDIETFASACTRCYACVNACPMEIITVPPPSNRSLGQFFQPEVKFTDSHETPGHGYCAEACTECSNVCPAGALTPLSLREKRQRQIGKAEVIRHACLAWADNEYCMVCQEHCPYGAISTDESEDYIPRPVVDESICRGCGFCQSTCPARREGKAILVRGVGSQNVIKDGYADLFDYDDA